MCVNSPNDSLCVSYRVKSMSSPKNPITSHSSHLRARLCLLLSPIKPFYTASCPRLQTKGSAAPARSDETEPGFESPAWPQPCPLLSSTAKQGRAQLPPPGSSLLPGPPMALPRVRVPGALQGHPPAFLWVRASCNKATQEWVRALHTKAT